MRIQALTVRGDTPPEHIFLTADSAAEARRILSAQGYTILRLTGATDDRRRQDRSGRFAVIVFASQLHSLLQAGLGVVEAIRALRANARDPDAVDVFEGVLAELAAGKTLSQAVHSQPAVFDELFVAMLASAERTSAVAPALRRYLDHARQIDEVRANLRQAALYPALLLGGGALVVGFLLFFVVPRFASVYGSVRTELPWAAQWLLAWGQAVKMHAMPMGAGFLLAVGAIVALVCNRDAQQIASSWVARLPRIGPFLRHVRMARLYRTLSMLLDGGIPVVTAMSMAAPVLDPAGQRSLEGARAEVQRGQSLSRALDDVGLLTPIARSLVEVGERSASLARSLDDSARFLETETGRELAAGMRVAEPVLMAVIGLVVGLVVVLMYLPIFELAGSLS